MSAADRAVLSTEETIALLEAQIKASGEDDLWIKISRRAGMLTNMVASLTKAKLHHITKPEAWLPQLCGGGVFHLSVGHVSNDTAPVGGPITVQYKEEPRDVDPAMISSPGWNGPKGCVYPDPNLVMPFGTRSPRDRLPGAAPRNDVPPADGSRGFYGDGGSSRENATIEALRRELENERAARAAEVARWEREQERLRNEARVRDMETRFAEQMRDMKASMEKMVATVTSAPKSDTMGQIVALVSPLVPVFQAMIQGQSTLRAEQLKHQDALAAEQRTLMLKMLDKPGVDPTLQVALDKMERAIEKAKEESGGAGEMLEGMSHAMSTVMNMALKNAAAMAEMNSRLKPGEEDPASLKAFKEGMRALESIFSAWGKSGGNGRAGSPGGGGGGPGGGTGQGGAQGQQQPPAGEPPDEVTQVVNAILAQRDPTEVATVIVQLAKTENAAFVKAMGEVGNNLNDLAVKRLGPEWMMVHVDYVKKLLGEVERLGQEAGVFGGEPPGDGKGESEGNGEVEESADEDEATP